MGSQLELNLRVSATKAYCDYCGGQLRPDWAGTTGGGVNVAGETLCNACCGFADAIDMVNTEAGLFGVTALYFVPGPSELSLIGKVSNWPGSLNMAATHVTKWDTGGFGSKRRTVYFNGPHGSWWSGVEYGGNAGNLLRMTRRLTHGNRQLRRTV